MQTWSAPNRPTPKLPTVPDSLWRPLEKDHSRSIMIVEHDMKFLFELVDRVIVLAEGKVYMQGTPEEVVNDPRLKELYFGG